MLRNASNPQTLPSQPFPQSMPLGGGGNQLATHRPPNCSKPHLQVPSLQNLRKYHQYHRSRKPLLLYRLQKRCPPGGCHNQDSLSQRKEVWQGAEKVVSVVLSEAIEDSGPAGKALSSLLLALIQLFIYSCGTSEPRGHRLKPADRSESPADTSSCALHPAPPDGKTPAQRRRASS